MGIDYEPTIARDTIVVVFSKDRPLQLDATLRSLKRHCADVGSAQIHVLFRVSAPSFAGGYAVVARDYPEVAFHHEEAFKADLLGIVAASEYVVFVVDDTLFFRPLSLRSSIECLERNQACLGFSYRLGVNTIYCYTLDRPQHVPPFSSAGDGALQFEWVGAEHDFGYPLEVSSSMYRTSDVFPLLEELEFRNPNTLESGLAATADSFRDARPRLACLEQSAAVSIPANLVQEEWVNRSDGREHVTARTLARRFDEGFRVDIDHYLGLVPNACHQELELRLVRDASIAAVSVIIPCFKQAQYLPEAVGSVVGQTYQDWEIIVVDDGSPDDIVETATRLSDAVGPRLRLIRQTNEGLPAARNAGIRAARGRYILPLDADDMIAPTMLERCVALLEANPDIAIAYTDLEQFGEATGRLFAADFDRDEIPEGNQLNYCSLYRREVWDAVNGYNTNMVWGYEDWDFWIAAVECGYRAQRIPEALLLYRIRAGSMFGTALLHDRELRARIRRNHPRTYRLSRRLARQIRSGVRRLAARVQGRVRRALRQAETRTASMS